MNETELKLKKREKLRHIVRDLLGLVLIVLEGLLFYYVWTHFFNPFARNPYRFIGNYFLLGVYFTLTLIFSRIYGGIRFGYYRVFDLILSQTVCAVVTNTVAYFVIVIPVATWYLSPLPLLYMTGVDILLIVLWGILGNRIFCSLFPPQRLAVIYTRDSDLLAAKFAGRPDQYEIVRCIRLQLWGEDAAEECTDRDCSAFTPQGQKAVSHTKDPWRAIDETGISEPMDGEIAAPVRPDTSATVISGLLDQKLAACRDCDGIIIGDIRADIRNDLLKRCYSRGIRTYTLPKVSDVILKSSEILHIFDSPVLLNRNYGLTAEQEFVKRCFDLVLSLVGVIVAAPFMIVTAVCIKAEDGGPVFYKQKRLTKDGREFEVIKFRSMRVDAEKDGVARLATEGDPRITKVGRVIRACRIDEIPQILNILKGDMSLVGPRPERPEICQEYCREMPEFDYRLRVKAGLTGYAQIYGKYNTKPYDKLKLDLMYIQSYSLLLDLSLVLQTIKIVFMKESTEGVEAETAYTAEDNCPEKKGKTM